MAAKGGMWATTFLLFDAAKMGIPWNGIHDT